MSGTSEGGVRLSSRASFDSDMELQAHCLVMRLRDRAVVGREVMKQRGAHGKAAVAPGKAAPAGTLAALAGDRSTCGRSAAPFALNRKCISALAWSRTSHLCPIDDFHAACVTGVAE